MATKIGSIAILRRLFEVAQKASRVVRVVGCVFFIWFEPKDFYTLDVVFGFGTNFSDFGDFSILC